ncbi:MAG: serine/threonine protein kinase [Xanthomonadales bacterium]|jgi:hypothetical protein|nr:serine/threonine protein kinase [Xanthomonadales bacterium]
MHATYDTDATLALSKAEQPYRALNLDLDDPEDRRFGDYELIERIASGGMGVVYRAQQLSLDREVALKLFAADPNVAETMLERFHNEARHAGRLQHPNIVPVYEIGRHQNLHYFSMGLVRGPALGHWLKQHPGAPAQQLAQWMRTIAEAVEYAHQVGILHLDLKPSNVLIDERGAPQVADFGLAHRIVDAAEGRVMVAGTPAYMAPEQAAADHRLDPRTDVWGLGAILHEMLTGSAPFPGCVDEDSLRRRLSESLPGPRSRNPAVPPDLDAICRHCLAVDPAARYASARELADDLQRYLDGRPVSVRDAGGLERMARWARREPRAAALAVGLVLALLLGFSITLGLWQRAETSRDLAEHTLLEARRQSALAAQLAGDPVAALPPLVQNIAEAEASGKQADSRIDRLRVALLLGQLPRQIGRIEGGGEGRSLAFAEDGGLLLASLRNGELAAHELPEGRERWRVVPPFPPTAWGNSFAGRMQPTPDGLHAVLHSSGSSGVARPDASAMQRIRLHDGAVLPLPIHAEAHSYAYDGRLALLQSAGRWQLWSTDPWQISGPAFPAEGRYCLLAVTGVAACAVQGFKQIEVVDARDGRPRHRFALGDDAELGAWQFSPEGDWLALGSTAGEVLLHHGTDALTHRLTMDGGIVDFHASAGRFVVADAHGNLRILDPAAGRWLGRALRTPANRMNSVTADLSRGWVVGNEGRVAIWKLPDGEAHENTLPTAIIRHRGALIGMHSVALDAARGLVASFGSEGEIKLLRLPQGPAGLDSGLVAGSAEYTVPMLAKPDRALEGAPVYLAARSAAGRTLRVGGRQLAISASTGEHLLSLPQSPHALIPHPEREQALLGWIAPEGRLRMQGRSIDLVRGQWIGPMIEVEGLVDGLRLAGDWLALWQGATLTLFDLQRGTPQARLTLDHAGLRITDAVLDTNGSVLLSTAARSRLSPATLEQWQRVGGEFRLQRRIETPTAHDRVFDHDGVWLGHGVRVASYAEERRGLAEFNSDWTEAAAVQGRLGAFATRHAVHLYDLDAQIPLIAALSLPLPRDDGLAGLSFADNGLQLRSHYGRVLALPLAPSNAPLAALKGEVDDLLPDSETPARISIEARRLRDPGEPVAPEPRQETQPARADWHARANVEIGVRFQGSPNGLGITDSAGWPTGRLRLRDVDYLIGPALQLAPAGTALGAAVFPAEAVLPWPAAAQSADLLLGNQLPGSERALAVDFLAADGRVLGSEQLALPASWDHAIHEPERAHQPAAPVALILRTAETRIRGGGSRQLLVYHLRLRRPAQAHALVALRLRAVDAAPLLLGYTLSESSANTPAAHPEKSGAQD